ncbi:MAG: Spc24 subunit of Ndc80-domain-containing protein [Piptocephalis tieghemiana]|nr:MAG: Spc24 subunit of Ndc80-domain-containing protein [Piptocephalis tieghemiana]
MDAKTSENLHSLTQQALENFRKGETLADARLLQRMSSKTEDKRTRLLTEAKSTLQGLTRELALARAAGERPEGSTSKEDYDQEMMELDRTKFTLAKRTIDLEMERQGLEAELDGYRRELMELEAEDAQGFSSLPSQDEEGEGMGEGGEGTEATMDSNSLKLALYNGLGISLQASKEDSSVYDQVIVRSPNDTDHHTIHLDGKQSHHFYTNHIWDLASS